MEKNFYLILKIERTATQKEVKKAYRTLAKELHPDVNPSVDAHMQFDELEKAYGVLSDEEARKQYDEFLVREEMHRTVRVGAFDAAWVSAFKKNSGMNRPVHASPLEVRYVFRPEDVFKESKAIVHFKRSHQCNKCSGTARVRVTPHAYCGVCGGKGSSMEPEKTMFGIISKRKNCDHCKGTGEETETCQDCNGVGLVKKEASAMFHIPRNATNGTKISLSKQGNKGLNGGQDGDLHIVLLLEKSERYTIDLNGNVFENIYVDALCFYEGVNVKVVLPDDKEMTLILPKGERPGYRINIPNGGMSPGQNRPRGDLDFVFQATLPNLSEDALRLIYKKSNSEGSDSF